MQIICRDRPIANINRMFVGRCAMSYLVSLKSRIGFQTIFAWKYAYWLMAVCVAVFFCGSARFAYAMDDIAWLIPTDSHSDPTHVAPLQFLIDHLPNYRHHIVEATSARANYELSRTPGTCSVGISRTPARVGVLHFSERGYLVSGFRFIVRSVNENKIMENLNSDGYVDLNMPLSSQFLHGAYVTGKPYPDIIWNFINIFRQKQMMESVKDIDPLLNILKAGRVDYVFLSYADLIGYELSNSEQSEFIGFPIAGVPRTYQAYIACSPGPLSKHLVADIDKLLADEPTWKEFV